MQGKSSQAVSFASKHVNMRSFFLAHQQPHTPAWTWHTSVAEIHSTYSTLRGWERLRKEKNWLFPCIITWCFIITQKLYNGQLPGNREGQQPLQQGCNPTVPKPGKWRRSNGTLWFSPWLSSSPFSVTRACPRASKRVKSTRPKHSIITIKYMQRLSTKAS